MRFLRNLFRRKHECSWRYVGDFELGDESVRLEECSTCGDVKVS